jgi:hypothetical protein
MHHRLQLNAVSNRNSAIGNGTRASPRRLTKALLKLPDLVETNDSVNITAVVDGAAQTTAVQFPIERCFSCGGSFAARIPNKLPLRAPDINFGGSAI